MGNSTNNDDATTIYDAHSEHGPAQENSASPPASVSAGQDSDSSSTAPAVKSLGSVLPEAQQQVSQVYQSMQEAEKVQKTVKQQTEEVLQKVKTVEEESLQSQKELQKVSEDAKEKLHNAQREVQRVEHNKQASEQKLQDLANPGGSNGTIAFDPIYLINALGTPPPPRTPSYRPPPKIDSDTKRQVEQNLQETTKQVQAAKQQLKSAEKQVDKAATVAQKTQQRQGKVIQRLGATIKQLYDDAPKKSGSDILSLLRESNPMLIVGILFFLAALPALIFAPPFVWATLLLIAVTQVAVGIFLRRKGWL